MNDRIAPPPWLPGWLSQNWPLSFVLGIYLFGANLLIPHAGGSGLDLPNNNIIWLLAVIFIALTVLSKAFTNKAIALPSRHNSKIAICALTLLLIPGLATRSEGLPWPLLGAAFICLFWLALIQYYSGESGKRNDTRLAQTLLLVIIGCGLLQSGIGLLQFFGLLQQIELGGGVLQTNFRPTGGFQQPNLLASFLAVSLAATATLWNGAPPRGAGYTPAYFFITSVFSTLLVVTASRTGWIAFSFVAILGTLGLLASKRKHLAILFLLAIGMGLSLAWLALEFGPAGNSLVAAKADLDTSRWILYPQVVSMLSDNLLWGVGYGNFEASYVKHAAAAFQAGTGSHPPMTNFNNSHNLILQLTCEGGLFALAGLFLFLTLLIKLIIRQPLNRDRLFLIAMILPLALHAMTEYPFRLSATHALTLAAIGAIGGKAAFALRQEPTIPTTIQSLLKVFALLLLILGPLYFANNLNTLYRLWRLESSTTLNIEQFEHIIWEGPLEERVNYKLADAIYANGMKFSDERLLRQFVAWAEPESTRLPRLSVLNALIIANNKLGNEANAVKATEMLEYYFPQYSDASLGPRG